MYESLATLEDSQGKKNRRIQGELSTLSRENFKSGLLFVAVSRSSSNQ